MIDKSGFVVAGQKADDLVAEIIIGFAERNASAPSVHVAYNDKWHFSVSDKPSDITRDLPTHENPVLSLISACIAVSEVFRIRFGATLGLDSATGVNDSGFFDFVDSARPLPKTLDFGGIPISWFGCGSIAHAACFALRGIRITRGNFHTVDRDIVKEKNVSKYLGVSEGELGSCKAVTLSEKLKRLGASAEPHKVSLNEYSRKVDFYIPLAIVSTDTSISRRDVQAKLPRIILNSWTGNNPSMLQAGVNRYQMSRGGACLICQYWENLEGHPDLTALGQKSGISATAFFESIRENEPISGRRLPESLAGLKVLEGYRAMCDAFEIPVGNLRRQFAVPFIAGIGGALLAFALVCEGSDLLGEKELPRGLLRFALSPAVTRLWREPVEQRANCICGDSDYLQAYRKKWSI